MLGANPSDAAARGRDRHVLTLQLLDGKLDRRPTAQLGGRLQGGG